MPRVIDWCYCQCLSETQRCGERRCSLSLGRELNLSSSRESFHFTFRVFPERKVSVFILFMCIWKMAQPFWVLLTNKITTFYVFPKDFPLSQGRPICWWWRHFKRADGNWIRSARHWTFNLYLSPADNNDSNFPESFHLLFARINPHWNAKCFHNWFFHLHYIWIRNESAYIIIIKLSNAGG